MREVLQAKSPFEQGSVYSKDGGVAESTLKAAEQGNIDTQFNLGMMYLKGEGVSQSFIQAAQWFRTAAEFGHIDAQYQIGVRYENGEGVPQDKKQAFQWYNKAGEQGQVDAQNRVVQDRHERYAKAAEMITQWMNEDPEDDEEVWPQIERELERERYGE